ncbi:MAG TPA: shikimate dehydrogenase [Acetobacteraceae bacterium]|nr:shikimate dehydrogenase [Acetobacteraceae bacterium]
MQDQPSALLGLIGAGIQGSLTPAMHEREGAAQGLKLIYKLIDLQKLGLDVKALSELLLAAERMGFAGLNITFPCKQEVIPHLTDLSDNARALHAVNTVVLRDGRRFGHNTDLYGYAENLRRGLPDAKRERVVQVGAGGAGSAVAEALMQLGVGQLTLFDTDTARARQVAADLCTRHGAGRAAAGKDLRAAIAEADGLVNTTPVGMAKLPGTPVPPEFLRPALWVSEIIYFPLETELLRAARAIGCRTLDGGGMAVFQAVRAFELFTGIKPDAERMRRHFDELRTKTTSR